MQIEKTLIDEQSKIITLKCEEIYSEINSFKEILNNKFTALMDQKKQLLNQILSEKNKLNQEKEAWEKEKQNIQKIQPLEDILKLNVGGKEDMCVRKSTLCHVKGSALEAMFSGRHCLQDISEKYFVDRNPLAFTMMIDFIRNHGKLYEKQNKHYEMLKLELQYWGIDENLFRDKPKSKFEIIQEMLDRDAREFFPKKDSLEFFYSQLDQRKLNFKDIYERGHLQLNGDFKIDSVQEVIQIKFGDNFDKFMEIGRFWAINPTTNDYVVAQGEIEQNDGVYSLCGFGNYIDECQFQEGYFSNKFLEGPGKIVKEDGTIEEGMFVADKLHGQGKRIYCDGTVEHGIFEDGSLAK